MLIYKLRSSLYTLDWSMAVARTIKVHDCCRCYTLDLRAERIKSFRSICDHAAFNSLISFVLYVCVFALALIYGRWIYIEEARIGAQGKTLFSRKFVIQSPLAWISISCAVKNEWLRIFLGQKRDGDSHPAPTAESKEHQQERKIPPLHSSDFAVCWFEDVSASRMKNCMIYGFLAFLHLWTWSHSRYGYLHLTDSVNWAEHNC